MALHSLIRINTAKGRVKVQAKEYWGSCDTLYFDEAKDQVILCGSQNGLATLY